MGNWQPLPLGLPLRTNFPQDVVGAEGGGCLEARSTDLQTKVGAVGAAKGDVDVAPNPPQSPVIREIAQKKDGVTFADPIAVLGSTIPDSPITSFAVRGAKDLNGNLVNNGDWVEHPAPGLSSADARLQHDGSEIRVHCETPLWYGIPRSVSKPTRDWPIVTSLWSEQDGYTVIDGPFAESAAISPPTGTQMGISAPDNQGIGRYNQSGLPDEWAKPMWGVQGDGGGQYEYAYWAISFVYDGYQESPLFLCPVRSRYYSGPTETYGVFRSVYADLLLYGVGLHTSHINKRVRKIRVYCAPANVLTGDPLRELTFYLAHETEVAEWTQKSTAHRYRLQAKVERINYPAFVTRLVCDCDTAFCDVGGEGEDAGETFVPVEDGLPRVIVGDDTDHTYHIDGVRGWRRVGATAHQCNLVINYSDTALRLAVDRAAVGNYVQVTLVFPFRWDTTNPTNPTVRQRFFVGDELTLRQTYTQLSGLPQQLTEDVSPPRRGGTSSGDRPIIHGFRDKDGKWQENGVRWGAALPSGVFAQDIFLPQNTLFLDFPIKDAVAFGSTYIFLGDNELVAGNFSGPEASWQLSDTRRGAGCVSRKSIVLTPYGVVYLSQDGVRILERAYYETSDGPAFIGGTPSGRLSLDIQDVLDKYRSEWSRARGWYSAVWNQYALHFPTSHETFVYDFTRKGWTSEYDAGLATLAACTGGDGHALIALYDPIPRGTAGGVRAWCASQERSLGASYKLKYAFGDPVHHKHLRSIVAHFTSTPPEIAAAFPFTIKIDGENAAGKRTTATLTPTSGKQTERLSLFDRIFTIEFSHFATVDAVLCEVDIDDRVR